MIIHVHRTRLFLDLLGRLGHACLALQLRVVSVSASSKITNQEVVDLFFFFLRTTHYLQHLTLLTILTLFTTYM